MTAFIALALAVVVALVLRWTIVGFPPADAGARPAHGTPGRRQRGALRRPGAGGLRGVLRAWRGRSCWRAGDFRELPAHARLPGEHRLGGTARGARGPGSSAGLDPGCVHLRRAAHRVGVPGGHRCGPRHHARSSRRSWCWRCWYRPPSCSCAIGAGPSPRPRIGSRPWSCRLPPVPSFRRRAESMVRRPRWRTRRLVAEVRESWSATSSPPSGTSSPARPPTAAAGAWRWRWRSWRWGSGSPSAPAPSTSRSRGPCWPAPSPRRWATTRPGRWRSAC